MPNSNALDNLITPRSIVAPGTAANWVGNTPTVPDGSRYVRGTVELLTGASSDPAVGMIESCEFSETGEMEKLGDGACGVEAYDFYDLGWKVDVTARFRKKDSPPRKGEIFTLAMPEGTQAEGELLRFVCTESNKSWSEKGIRKCKFSGEISNALIRATLVTARLAGDAAATAESSSYSTSSAGFGDGDGAAATGLLTRTSTNVTDGNTVTIASTVYRFKNTPTQAYDVAIGITAAATQENLKMAINATGVAGTNYHTGTLVHPTVAAGTIASATMAVSALAAGTAGNSIATTTTAATLSWGAATLTGGAA